MFKIELNGILCARLVACVYSQIYGVDYTVNYEPVINDVTWCVILIVMLLNNYDGKLFYIELVFFHGDLEDEIYMGFPHKLEDA